jgi:hypothetical protein
LAITVAFLIRLAFQPSTEVSIGMSSHLEPERLLRPALSEGSGATHLPPAFWVDLATAAQELDANRRSAWLERAAESIATSALAAALDSLIAETSPAALELQQLLVRRWAEADGPRAAQWAAQLAESSLRRDLLSQAVVVWAGNDLAAAVAWVNGLADSPSKESATLSLAYEADRGQPTLALELASRMSSTHARDDLLVHSIGQWASGEPDAALQWVEQVSDPLLQQRLLAAAAVALARNDGIRAAALVAGSLPAGDEQSTAAVAVVQRWVLSSPEAAAQWVARFPDSPVQNAAVENLVGLWASFDCNAAKTWVGGLPESHLREAAMAAYASLSVTGLQQTICP